MFDCKRFLECLSDHFDGELDEELLLEFEAHIEACKNARAIVNTFRSTISVHKKTEDLDVPEDVRRRLHEAVRCCMEKQDDQ